MAFIYMIRCAGGELYVGITTDVHRRMQEHLQRGGAAAKYTRAHPAVALAALWEVSDMRTAARVEYRLKRYRHEKKAALAAAPSLLGTGDYPLPDGILPVPRGDLIEGGRDAGQRPSEKQHLSGEGPQPSRGRPPTEK